MSEPWVYAGSSTKVVLGVDENGELYVIEPDARHVTIDRDGATAYLADTADTVGHVLTIIRNVDEWLDSDLSPEYRTQPLAHDWARITKVCEEAGEVWKALSRETGENPRKGVCGTEAELLEELADAACAAVFAIQHRTKDSAETASVIVAALEKARGRAAKAGYGS